MISRWQDEMLAEGYVHSTVLAKRAGLKTCLELARVNGCLEGVNPVEAVAAPIKRERQDEDRAITPQEWGLIRAQLSGEGTTLLFDITLHTPAALPGDHRLRPMDVIDAADKDPAHLHLRHVIAWPGRKCTAAAVPVRRQSAGAGRRGRGSSYSRGGTVLAAFDRSARAALVLATAIAPALPTSPGTAARLADPYKAADAALGQRRRCVHELLSAIGYEPYDAGEATCCGNCPFHRVAERHRESCAPRTST
jgi:hypothetical protein